MLEILAPAGNAECAKAAIHNGANAIYLGYRAFSARQSAENFDENSLRAIVQEAHFCGVKAYVAMNTLVKDSELEAFMQALLSVWETGADAIIMQDVLLGKAIHERYPKIVLHLSTQAGVCNENGAYFAKKCGFSRVILARETPLSEIEKITKIIETEAFVQGALCTCFSGQCYFSSFAGGNSGNRGRCKQPCRKLYAYDRNDNTEKNYALSLSDLCVGEDIEKYIRAGVTSFKIEGRMRRAEYVAAAVRYYRTLLDGAGNTQSAFSDLKRTYNRGNYTKGLAFGQDKRFLSTAVQGHIGEKIGVVKVVNGQYIVDSAFQPRQGDAFKILREGKEVGGAAFVKTEKRGFILSAKSRLKNGDGVFITTDCAVNERVLQGKKRVRLSLWLQFQENGFAVAEGGGVRVLSDERLQSATSRPLTAQEVKACFEKTDGLPIEIEFEKVDIQGNIFIPKSSLNAFRRKFFNLLAEKITKNGHEKYEFTPFIVDISNESNEKTAVIAADFEGVKADVAIYKPDDFNAPLPRSFIDGDFEKYILYPAFCTTADERAIENRLKEGKIDGIYAENYAGMEFAEKNSVSVFAGTGFNLFNAVAVTELLKNSRVRYYALSKELNENEQKTLLSAKAFSLGFGNMKLMDLCYCPFGKTCASCDKKGVYTLTDENGREFPVRRYFGGDGDCRFEVYNCATLIKSGESNAGTLIDFTLIKDKTQAISAINDTEKQKTLCQNYTFGHAKRGVL